MLEKVRQPRRARNIKSIIAYVLFGIICFSFVFLGLTPDGGGRGGNFEHGGAAAYVNDVIISVADFRERLQYHERQAGEQFSQLPAAQRNEQTREMKGKALRELVESQLRTQAANEAGIYASDAAVRDQLVNIPAFQEAGRFDRSRYDQYLAYMRTTPGEFEKKVRADIVDNQLRQAFFKVMKSPAVIQTLDHQLRDTKLNLDFVQIDSGALKSATPSDAEARAFLATPAGKEQVAKYYETNKSEFTSRAEVQASHILVKPKADAKGVILPSAWDEALTAIKKIQSDAKKEDFGQLAAKLSDDAGSKGRNGDLGFFGRGQMAKEFEDAAFTQPLGQVGEPVKTTFGYHLIKVAARRGGGVKPLAEVEVVAAKNVLTKTSSERFTTELETAVKEGKDVAQLLASQNLKWQETGEFDLSARFVPKVGDHSGIVDAALGLKKPGEVSRQIVRSNGQMFLVRLKALKPASSLNSDTQNFAFSMGAIEVLNTWSQRVREKSVIRLNDSLLQ